MSEISPQWELKWIDRVEDLEELAVELGKNELLSLDTETVGWQTGNEKLCLIQIGIPSNRSVAVIDVLACSNLKALEAVMGAKSPQKIAHNAIFEEKQLGRHGIKLRGVVDTLEMSRRLRPDLPGHSLKVCCKYILNLDLSKAEQSSDWSRRPLLPEQLNYARLDAEVAFELYQALLGLQARLELDPALKVTALMRELHELNDLKFELTKTIATELAYLNLRGELIREAIRAKLLDGEPAYKGEFGSCHITKVKKTEISPAKVRAELASIADLAISEYVEKKRLVALMLEHGIDQSMLNLVEDVVGYTDRLYLKLGEQRNE